MLTLKGFLGVGSNIGNEEFAVPATPSNAFVGGMPATRSASGLTLCTSYLTADRIVGLFRYSEATFVADANSWTSVDVKATYVRDAVGIGISEGTDTQSGIADAMCPYDKTKTYAADDLLYVNNTTGQLTNSTADAGGATARSLGKVITAPTDASSGTEMIIQVWGDLI